MNLCWIDIKMMDLVVIVVDWGCMIIFMVFYGCDCDVFLMYGYVI